MYTQAHTHTSHSCAPPPHTHTHKLCLYNTHAHIRAYALAHTHPTHTCPHTPRTHMHTLHRFIDATTLEIEAEDGTKSQIKAKNTIIATGSEPAELSFMPFNDFTHRTCVSSTGLCNCVCVCVCKCVSVSVHVCVSRVIVRVHHVVSCVCESAYVCVRECVRERV